MERVVFMVEETGRRIGALLNPNSVVVHRASGVRGRSSSAGHVTGFNRMDDPVLFTGGGRTDIDFELLFDITLAESAREHLDDVRELTRPLMMLAENSYDDLGLRRPPMVRLIWGKAWNIPGVITHAAERFERFRRDGVPQRSWMSVRLRRIADPEEESFAEFPVPRDPAVIDSEAEPAGVILTQGDGEEGSPTGTRHDTLAHQAFGNPLDWRLIAVHNDLDDPLDVPPGTPLEVPATNGGSAGREGAGS